MNTGRKSPMCAEWSLECETLHGLRMQKELPFQNKANIWVFPGCTIALVHECLQSSLIHRFGARVNVSADFMVQLLKNCKLYERGHCGCLIKHHSYLFSLWRNVRLLSNHLSMQAPFTTVSAGPIPSAVQGPINLQKNQNLGRQAEGMP